MLGQRCVGAPTDHCPLARAEALVLGQRCAGAPTDHCPLARAEALVLGLRCAGAPTALLATAHSFTIYR